MGAEDAEALLAKLRESHLSTDERRAALDSLRNSLDSLSPEALPHVAKAAINDGPNDVRRIAFQTLSSRIDADLFKDVTDDSARDAVRELIGTIETFLRSTLKLQNARSVSSSSRATTEIGSLSASALRATAAALKTLHALIRISPKRARSTTLASQDAGNVQSLVSLFDIILPCLSAGLQMARSTPASIPRSSSTLQSSAFSWTDPSRQPRHPVPRNSIRTADHLDSSSAGETDRKSDKSESERSDFSAASSSRSRKDESRQQEATTKLIRQNALHCLVELNAREARALSTRWSDLLPDQPAMPPTPDRSVQPSSATARFSAARAAPPFSLCTLLTQDPSTSVRLAVTAALASVLSHGALQLSMAQERAQRALSFTSLSSQLAGWIVNVRSYLVVALQRAAAAPRASVKEAGAEVVGYPSSLTLALLQLTRTFVFSTAKAKLVVANASVLAPPVMAFASNSDPQVQAAAKQLMALLTPAQSKPTSAPTVESRTASDAGGGAITTPSQSGTQSDTVQLDLAGLLGDGVDLALPTCERILATFEAANDPLDKLPTWSIFVKSIADAPTPLLDPSASARLFAVSQRLCAQPGATADQHCAVLSTVPDVCRALSSHAALEPGRSTCILQYVESRCTDADEAVRAAAVRVLGLLVLPSDTAIDATDEHHGRIASTLGKVLWASHDKPGALHDTSSLVRQRASWAFSNAMEARLRSLLHMDEHEWTAHARYCLEAGRDMEGVAVSACRASGTLLALLTPASASSPSCRSLARSLLDQLCRVLGTTSKPPKSRWNAASALERALGSEVVLKSVLDGEGLMDRVVELLCSSLDAKVFKVRVSAANALVSLCGSARRLEVLGEQRTGGIRRFALARLAELEQPAASKKSTLYLDELQRLLTSLVASLPPSSSS
ncbi:conserved hypothetical protein [Sporisorium reilianum SRZ2]|uniref:DUF4042 domain-containing protein n=1 Tax=Sporisorium reilianum (strain SRZ2) TaxID=999809 RepID=E6ZYD1_SPORE|nr:conserved hypothetical protein [Sporisorium reilianum SRZ2]